MTDTERSALADSVSHMVSNMLRDLQHPDADSIIAHYDARVAYGRDGRILDRDSLLDQMRAGWRPGVSAALGTSDEKVRVLGRDIAVFSANVSGVVRDSAAAKSADIVGAVTFVLERSNGSWHVVAGHESMPAAIR